MTPHLLLPSVFLIAGLVIGVVAGGLYETTRIGDSAPAQIAVTNRLTGAVKFCHVGGTGENYVFVCR